MGCLDEALKYPKDFSPTPTVEEKNKTEIVELTGLISLIDTQTNNLQITLTDNQTEEILVASEASVVWNGAAGKLSDLTTGSFAKIYGTRDLASLIITARTIRASTIEKLLVVSPTPGSTVTSPVIIEGFLKNNYQGLSWQIKTSGGASQLSETNNLEQSQTAYSAFRLEIYLPALEQTEFQIELSAENLKTKKTETLLSLPLSLLSINKSTLNIFFANNQLNTRRSCTEVFPVTRSVAETSALGRASLLQILNGPSENERYQGYRSSLPYKTIINSFIISGGIATVTVSKDIEKTSNCEKQRAFEQIKQTLLQIPSVKEVMIRIE